MKAGGPPLVLLLATIALFTLSTGSSAQSTPTQYLIPLHLRSELPLHNGTIVEVPLDDLIARLPPDFNPYWNATTVLHQGSPVPSQVEIYNTSEVEDLLVFKTSEPQDDGKPEAYQIWIPSERLGLEVSPITNISMLNYTEFGSTPFGYPGASYSDQMGSGYLLQNTKIRATIPLEPPDLAASVFNLLIQESRWDALKQERSPLSQTQASAWRNSSFGHVWEKTVENGYELVALATGPLRGTLILRTDAQDGEGELWKTYHIFNDDTLIELESFIFNVSAPSSSIAALLDQYSLHGEFDTIHVPGIGALSRDERSIPGPSLADAWVLAYNQSGNRALAILFDERPDTLQWNQDSILARYSEKERIRTAILSIDSTVTSDPARFVADTYSVWNPRPTVEVLPAEASELAPSRALDSLAEKIGSLEAEIEVLQMKTENLEADLAELDRQLLDLLSELNLRQNLYIVSAILGTVAVASTYVLLKRRYHRTES